MRETGSADLRAADFMRVHNDQHVNARYHGLSSRTFPGTRWPRPDGRPARRPSDANDAMGSWGHNNMMGY